VKEIYLITDTFPKQERYSLTTQIRRAAMSVSNNLAEGSARLTPRSQAYFTQISYGSLMEVLNQLILANDLGYLDDQNLKSLRSKIDELGNKLNAYRNSQLK
jgi:four helix bundle protein